MKKIITALSALAIMASCTKEPVEVTPVVTPETKTSFVFKQFYDGEEVLVQEFGTKQFTNARGTVHTISKLQYLVSDITLHRVDGSEVNLGGYNFINMDMPLSRFYTPATEIPTGSYAAISLTFGFNEEDNVSGQYLDLNAASWAWPEMIGGGYHFLKFEGMFRDNTNTMKGFAFHNGTASRVNDNGTRTAEANHFRVKLWDLNGGFSIEEGDNTLIDVNMNLAEWFKNPLTWNLDEYHMMLMPNYTAQKMMNQNGRTVFSLGVVSKN